MHINLKCCNWILYICTHLHSFIFKLCCTGTFYCQIRSEPQRTSPRIMIIILCLLVLLLQLISIIQGLSSILTRLIDFVLWILDYWIFIFNNFKLCACRKRTCSLIFIYMIHHVYVCILFNRIVLFISCLNLLSSLLLWLSVCVFIFP